MTALQRLYADFGQNPWLDNITRGYLRDGTPARNLDTGVAEAAAVMRGLAAAGVDLDDVGRTLEDQGVAAFHASYQEVIDALRDKAGRLGRR
jgi:transaldolase